MEASNFAAQRVEKIFRETAALALKMEGATWTLSVLREPARTFFLENGFELSEEGHCILEEVAQRMGRRQSEVQALAHAAGLRVSDTPPFVLHGLVAASASA